VLSSPANLWRRRHLIRVLVTSNIKRQSRHSSLGYLWWLIDPLLMTAVYYVVVSILFQRGGHNQPYILFLMCGLLPWKAFSDSVSQSVGAIKASAGIIKAISFPRAVLPLSFVLSNLIFFGFALMVLVGLALAYGPQYGTWPGAAYLWLPGVALVQLVFTAGVALIVSTLGVIFSDTSNIIGHILRMAYFLSPGLYSVEQIPTKFRIWFGLNPFSGIMESYRAIVMRNQAPPLLELGQAAAIAAATLLAGYWLFRSREGYFVQRL
jgi:lipopolysaccharide transport system permease protein/teichoic acid transport system permease protein